MSDKSGGEKLLYCSFCGKSQHEVRKLIHEIASQKAIVISTHILEEVDAVCSRAVVIARGKVIADDTPAGLAARATRHNAISFTAPVDMAEAIKTELGSIEGIAGVQDNGTDRGRALITAFPQQGAEIAAAVAERAAANNWAITYSAQA